MKLRDPINKKYQVSGSKHYQIGDIWTNRNYNKNTSGGCLDTLNWEEGNVRGQKMAKDNTNSVVLFKELVKNIY